MVVHGQKLRACNEKDGDRAVEDSRIRPEDGSHSDELEEHLPRLREALELERDFRLEQLAELSAFARASVPRTLFRHGEPTAAVREVSSVIAAGARQVLTDVERALAAMGSRTYGRCEACTGQIPLVLLQTIPQARLCLKCQATKSRRRRRRSRTNRAR